MIKPGEIQQKARNLGVRDQQIEKDYIISWILKGIGQHELLSKSIVFKGGTVLKKIYFQNYRFSEDLDFTLINNEVFYKQILEWFQSAFEYIKDESNISLQVIDDFLDETNGFNFYISYVGPLGGQQNSKRVKIDISKNEKLVFEPILNAVFIDYSDLSENKILCYSLEEVLVEKMRCVMQRMQARDFYDIWYLLEKYGMDVNFYLKQFEIKCKDKKINYLDFPKKLKERLPQYKGRWKGSMNEQIKDLPDFEKVEREVLRHIKKLILL